jgi:hypothetical protein
VRKVRETPSKTEAKSRRDWIAGELAALRVPDLNLLDAEPVKAPPLRDATERWRASRIDVDDGTRTIGRAKHRARLQVRLEARDNARRQVRR